VDWLSGIAENEKSEDFCRRSNYSPDVTGDWTGAKAGRDIDPPSAIMSS